MLESEQFCFSTRKPQVGDILRIKRRFTEEDVKLFAKLSGDCNPLHLDKSIGLTYNLVHCFNFMF